MPNFVCIATLLEAI